MQMSSPIVELGTEREQYTTGCSNGLVLHTNIVIIIWNSQRTFYIYTPLDVLSYINHLLQSISYTMDHMNRPLYIYK